MITIEQLKTRLTNLEQKYQQTIDTQEAMLYAKIAMLEASGWTEEYIDSIIMDFVSTRNPLCKDKIINKLKKTYGFEYKKEFRGIIVEIIGSLGLEEIEKKISLDCQQLETALKSLKDSRDVCAHTHIQSGTNIDAPSIAIDHVTKIESKLNTFKTHLFNIQISSNN